MVLHVKNNSNNLSRAMDHGIQQKLAANILLLGAENVGKSGKTRPPYRVDRSFGAVF